MIKQHQLDTLTTANKHLQRAWNGVLMAKQGQNPTKIQNAVLRYLQTLQQVNVMVEAAIATK